MSNLGIFKRHNTITERIVISFIVGALIPTVIVVFILCYRFESNFKSNAEEQVHISGELVVDLFTSKFDSLNTITMAPYYADYFSSSNSISPSDADYLSRYSALQNELSQLFNMTAYSSPDISDLAVWTDGIATYHITYNENWFYSMLPSIQEQPWFEHAISCNGRMAFTPAYTEADLADDEILTTDSIFITRQIRNIRNPDQQNIVILNLNTEIISRHLAGLNLIYDTYVVVTNECGELIYSSNPITREDLEKVCSSTSFQQEGDIWNSESFALDEYDLNIYVVYSMNDLYSQLKALIFSALAIYLIGLTAAYFLFRRYSRWIFASVNALLSTFKNIENGNLESHCPPLKVYEFDKLGKSVNNMTDRLHEKIKNEYLLTIRQKSLQLYALQSQIQPHFINNTIYCFIALNQLNQQETLNSALYSFSHLLRYVLSKESHTTVKREYAFLQDYISLQKLRFSDRLSFELVCPEALMSVKIPRLILQPLVENAIIHGIEPCEHPCFCRISCTEENETFKLQVEDNGIGFDPIEFQRKIEKAAAAVSDFSSDYYLIGAREKTSVGLYYVKERLNMWSPRATMRIRRDSGTTIMEISVPMEDISNEDADSGR